MGETGGRGYRRQGKGNPYSLVDIRDLFPASGPVVIAGPCSAESQAVLLESAVALKAAGVEVLRCGLWKPRTRPGDYEGPGYEGLQWLMRVKRETGMRVCTEVATPEHVKACADAGVDLVWIGARTVGSPFQLQLLADALGASGLPVLLKNPLNPDAGLWEGAIERLKGAGVKDIGLVHRGFNTTDAAPYRNAPLWQLAARMKAAYPELPFFSDPSHMAGDRRYVGELAQRALDLGLADGLMIEVHPEPEKALSDAAQQLSPRQFKALMEGLVRRCPSSADEAFQARLEALRTEIDRLDGKLLAILEERQEVSREIGRYKKEQGVEIVQPRRWEQLLESRLALAREAGLDQAAIKSIMEEVHRMSIQVQK